MHAFVSSSCQCSCSKNFLGICSASKQQIRQVLFSATGQSGVLSKLAETDAMPSRRAGCTENFSIQNKCSVSARRRAGSTRSSRLLSHLHFGVKSQDRTGSCLFALQLVPEVVAKGRVLIFGFRFWCKEVTPVLKALLGRGGEADTQVVSHEDWTHTGTHTLWPCSLALHMGACLARLSSASVC